MRIVSLLPSATEIVCALGLEEHLVGRSHECLYPPTILDRPVVTRSLIPPDLPSHEIDRLVSETLMTHATLYTLDLELLQALQPDLILTQALCSVCAVPFNTVQEAIAVLQPKAKVLNLEPTTLQGVVDTFLQVAEAAGMPERGRTLAQQFWSRVERVAERSQNRPRVKVSFLEWIAPPFACGHWIPEMVALAGGVEGHGEPDKPSRRLAWDEVLAWQPEAIVIACCGYSIERTLQDMPLLEAQPGWHTLPAVRAGHIFITDGIAYFSCPSPRLADALEWLAVCLDAVRDAAPVQQG